MADVEIEFGGVMMFVLRDDRVEVLIPEGTAGTYPDSTVAKPHYPWLYGGKKGSAGQYPLRQKLSGIDATIGTKADRVPRVDLQEKVFKVNGLLLKASGGAPIEPMVDPLASSSPVGCRITLFGGTLVAEGVKPNCLHTLDEGDSYVVRASAERVVWRSAVESIDFGMTTKSGGIKPISLIPTNSPHHVDNLDYAAPEEKPTTAPTESVFDTDFAWSYTLFGAVSWERILTRGMLPIPTKVPQRVSAPTASGCNCRPCVLDLRTMTP